MKFTLHVTLRMNLSNVTLSCPVRSSIFDSRLATFCSPMEHWRGKIWGPLNCLKSERGFYCFDLANAKLSYSGQHQAILFWLTNDDFLLVIGRLFCQERVQTSTNSNWLCITLGNFTCLLYFTCFTYLTNLNFLLYWKDFLTYSFCSTRSTYYTSLTCLT